MFTVNPSLGYSLPEARFFECGINQLLEVEDEHDDKAFLVFDRDNVHQAGSAGPCEGRERCISKSAGGTQS